MAPLDAPAIEALMLRALDRQARHEEIERAVRSPTEVAHCRCGSLFLRRCSTPGWAVCRTCGRVTVLGPRESFPAEFPTGVVTTIHGHADLPDGMVVARRWTVRGLQCERVVQGRAPEEPGEATG